MRKILISILCIFIGFSNVAIGENILTTQSFVDSSVAQKQDKIPANNGTEQILMNTGTDGSVGTKNIYDSTASYGGQNEALIDAATMNAAVQNAIDTEFVCIEWVDPNDHNSDCLLVDIRGVTDKPSGKNLFNLQKSSPMRYTNGGVRAKKNSNGYVITLPGTNSISEYRYALIEIGDIQDFMGKTITVSAVSECINGGSANYILGVANDTGSTRKIGSKTVTVSGSYTEPTFTKVALWLYATQPGGNGGINPSCTYTNIQVEEGSTATAYEPYQNLYLPSGN